MKKVLRYPLDDYLRFVFDRGVVRDNLTGDYVQCDIIVKMSDGEYRILLDNYLVRSYLIDDEVVVFPEDAIYLEWNGGSVELACIVYNEKQYDEGSNGYFIDEIYFVDGEDSSIIVPEPEDNKKPLRGPVYNKDLTRMEQVELLMENYNSDYNL